MVYGPFLVDAGSLVTSGAAIDLGATEHTATWNAYWTVPDVPSKPTGSSYNWRLSQGRYTGITGPSHSITGAYDDTLNPGTNATNLTTNGAYLVTGSMLSGIMLSGSVFALVDGRVNKINQQTGGAGSLVYVVPTSYKVLRGATHGKGGTDKRGYVINYSLDMKEVRV